MEIQGFAWEKAGWIWYLALRDKLTPKANFREMALCTYQVAGEHFGTGSLEQQAVKKAWGEVGLALEAPAGAPGCLPGLIAILNLFPLKQAGELKKSFKL